MHKARRRSRYVMVRLLDGTVVMVRQNYRGA